MKVDIDRVLAAPTACDGSLSTVGFDRSAWEIMYPLFVAEGFIDTSARVSTRDTRIHEMNVGFRCAPWRALCNLHCFVLFSCVCLWDSVVRLGALCVTYIVLYSFLVYAFGSRLRVPVNLYVFNISELA
jgi:hypothetical protein